jgi:hypothetical protein
VSVLEPKRRFLTTEEAESLLPSGDYVHTTRNPATGLFLGADWERPSLIKAFKEAHRIELGGPACMGMGHGILVWEFEDSARPFFVEHDAEAMTAFDTPPTTGETPAFSEGNAPKEAS